MEDSGSDSEDRCWGQSGSETESEEAVGSDSESDSDCFEEEEQTMMSEFVRMNTMCVDGTEADVCSCKSVGEVNPLQHQNEANVLKTLKLTARVLYGRSYGGPGKPILSQDVIERKRNEMNDRHLAWEHVNVARISARALLNVGFFQHKLPYVCVRRIAQFFKPRLSLRDLRRSFHRKQGPVRNVCVDICSLRLVYPSWFEFATKRKQQYTLDSKRHALWCYAAWMNMFASWKPLDDDVGSD